MLLAALCLIRALHERFSRDSRPFTLLEDQSTQCDTGARSIPNVLPLAASPTLYVASPARGDSFPEVYTPAQPVCCDALSTRGNFEHTDRIHPERHRTRLECDLGFLAALWPEIPVPLLPRVSTHRHSSTSTGAPLTMLLQPELVFLVGLSLERGFSDLE
jgi:hypothetical protein